MKKRTGIAALLRDATATFKEDNAAATKRLRTLNKFLMTASDEELLAYKSVGGEEAAD